MLKGHVFSKQLFEHPIFALFVNTFLNGRNGVSNNYKEGMKLSYSGSAVTISSGAVCIQGRFLEETLHSQISAGNESAYCKLVIEVDLDKQNTESEFLQARYRVVKSTSGYPNLTQNNIVKNNAGIYQYELARFRTGSSGITNFEDKRTFLDLENILNLMEKEFESFLAEFREKISNVEDGSSYVLKDDYAIIEGVILLSANNPFEELGKQTTWEIDFPIGFSADNCICLSFETKSNQNKNSGFSTGTGFADSIGMYTGDIPKTVMLGRASTTDSKKKIWCQALNLNTSDTELRYRIVLLRINKTAKTLTLGDVNGDGVINQEDYNMIQKFLSGETALTSEQYIAADMNKDGKVTSSDYVNLKNRVDSQGA